MQFFIPMAKPPTVTHQEKAVRVVKGKPVFYEPAALADARQKFTAHLAPHAPEAPLTGPLLLMVKWCFPITGKHQDGEYKATRPDTDNLQKLLKDVMTQVGFWKDDALVCSEICEKFYAATPGLFICVEELGRENDDD